MFFLCIFPYTVWLFDIHLDFFVLQGFFFFNFLISWSQCLLKAHRYLQCTIWYYLIRVLVWMHGQMESGAKSREERSKRTSWSTFYGVLFFFFLLKYGQFLTNSQRYPGPNYYNLFCQESIPTRVIYYLNFIFLAYATHSPTRAGIHIQRKKHKGWN